MHASIHSPINVHIIWIFGWNITVPHLSIPDYGRGSECVRCTQANIFSFKDGTLSFILKTEQSDSREFISSNEQSYRKISHSMEETVPQVPFGITDKIYKYDGVTFHTFWGQKEILQKIEETCFNTDDIFIATYPKSGMYCQSATSSNLAL